MLALRTVLLVAGMASGISLALNQLAQNHTDLPDAAVARVNQHVISRDHYDKALAAMTSDLRRSLSEQDKQHVLTQLINEELLFQRALQQGMAHTDARVRRTLVSAMLDSQRMQVQSLTIDTAAARTFYQQNAALFAPQWRYRVGHMRLLGAQAQAEAISQALNQGQDYATVSQAYHQAGALQLPDDFLPLSKLRDYLGTRLSQQISQLQPGQATAPSPMGQGWELAYLHERRRAAPLDWEELQPQVIAEMRRRAAEQKLHDTLKKLRNEARIRISDAL